MSKFMHYIYKGCFYFTIFVLLGSVVGVSSEIKNFTPSLTFLVIALLYGLFISFSSKIYDLPLNRVLKVLIHFLAHVAFFALDFIYFGGYYKNGVSAFLIMLIFIVCYIIISLIAWGIKKLISLAVPQDESYTKAFKN